LIVIIAEAQGFEHLNRELKRSRVTF